VDVTELLQLDLRSRVLFKLTLLFTLSLAVAASPLNRSGISVPVVVPKFCRLTEIILVTIGKPVSG